MAGSFKLPPWVTGAVVGAGAGIGSATGNGQLGENVGSNVAKTGGAIASTAGFLSWLSNESSWVRIMKVGLGAILITAGVIQLTGAKTTVIELAGTAAKAAAL